jgi:hypothetical protein
VCLRDLGRRRVEVNVIRIRQGAVLVVRITDLADQVSVAPRSA